MDAAILKLISELPDSEAACRFLDQLAEQHPRERVKLVKNDALLSDVATLAAFSPLLATTLLQNPGYIWWLNRKRIDSGVRSKDELLESLARFSLTNSQLAPQVLFARFRRRELLRIYLRDIRRLATIAEITEEISNLADAILESALTLARNEIDLRFGSPQETDDKDRLRPARFCIVALGKLGSRELNYSSDIDLLFLYSGEGMTTGSGSRGAVTNREYFVKLAEYTTKIIGQQTGEGAAYRVDLRLRPHGTLGALAISVQDAIRYITTEARAWERQVLIRSRGCAGDIELFREYFSRVDNLIFSKNLTVETALANVRRSKEQIDLDNVNRRGFNVKLGRGGVREIEFLAQALQLAYGGTDLWLRSPHTLISLDRLGDRKHLSETELTQLSAAYEFLRRTEHILQMENGVQTHTVPDETDKRALLARRMTFASGGNFETDLEKHTNNVSRIFARVFGETRPDAASDMNISEIPNSQERTRAHIRASIEKSNISFDSSAKNTAILDRLTAVSPHFASMLAASPQLAVDLPDPESEFAEPDYGQIMMAAATPNADILYVGPSFQEPAETSKQAPTDLGQSLAAMRQTWSHLLLEIVIQDVFEKITIDESKRLQTSLAEATIAAALKVVGADQGLAVLALGKLGGRGIDYGSDLDLIVVYEGSGTAEHYARIVEQFVTVLSSMTRDGILYRVDLRLRPYGSKGLSAMSKRAFLEYMGSTAEVWEMLAFVKLRAAGGDKCLGEEIERETRRIIHERASELDPALLRAETRRVRLALQHQRSRPHRKSEIDIKYGEGGMLDVYFAMRYLQLRDNIPDDTNDRTTRYMLRQLHANGSISNTAFSEMLPGYEFLSELDHNLRLTVGRTTRVPVANINNLNTIAKRLNLKDHADLLENLALHRLTIRTAFDNILTA